MKEKEQKAKELILKEFKGKKYESIVKQAAIDGAKDQNEMLKKSQELTLENWKEKYLDYICQNGCYECGFNEYRTKELIDHLLALKDKEVIKNRRDLLKIGASFGVLCGHNPELIDKNIDNYLETLE